MYRIVRASTLYYANNMKNAGARYDLIKPFLLLTDTKLFNEAYKEKNTDYLNLCNIINKIRELYSTGKEISHHFGYLLNELETLGFKVNSMKYEGVTDDDILKDQIDLLLQFMAYRYPFDEYDNKTGVHDYRTNEWIFVQP